MKKEQILEKVGWLTTMKNVYVPPKTQEEIECLKLQKNEFICNMFTTVILFLQAKRLTTRTVLGKNDTVNDESKITIGDLTEDGFRFYQIGITEWIGNLDRSANRMDIVSDTSFLENKYQEYITYEKPFFKKLLSQTKDDKNILKHTHKLTPIIEKIISELDGNMKVFFTARDVKTTIKLMSALCYGYSKLKCA